MKKIKLNNIKTFGKTVTTFPAGVGEAFNELITATGDKAGERDYYGISFMDNNGKMIYKALTAEKNNDEASKYGYEKFTVEPGEYYYETLKNWRSKTDCIKDIFAEMLKDEHVNKMKPAVEWYKNDDEMLCLLKAL